MVIMFFYYFTLSLNRILKSTFSISMPLLLSIVHVTTLFFTITDYCGSGSQVMVNFDLTTWCTSMITDLLYSEEHYFMIGCLDLRSILYPSFCLGRKDPNWGRLTHWIRRIVLTILDRFCIDSFECCYRGGWVCKRCLIFWFIVVVDWW